MAIKQKNFLLGGLVRVFFILFYRLFSNIRCFIEIFGIVQTSIQEHFRTIWTWKNYLLE